MARFLLALKTAIRFITLPKWKFYRYPSLKSYTFLHSKEGKQWLRELEEEAKKNK